MSAGQRLPASIQTISEVLAYWAERTPDAPALRSIDGRELSYRELLKVSESVGVRLSERGITAQDRVAFLLPPGLDATVAVLGAMKAAVAVPFDAATTRFEVTRDLQRLPTRLVVTHGATEAVGREVAATLGIAAVTLDELVTTDWRKSLRTEERRSPDPARTAVILHTSGTTGLPKRVPRSDRALVIGARTMGERTGLVSDDVLLLAASLANIGGLGNLLNALISGGSCVIAPHFHPVDFSRWLQQQPTWTFLTPTRLLVLLEAATAGRATLAGPRTRLRLVRAGSQPMTPELHERAERSLRAPLFDTYGMTEAPSIAAPGPAAADRRQGSVGRPLAVRLRILDDNGTDVPTGMVGEIVVRGPTVFAGYLDDAEATAAAFAPGGWFRTGDLGRLNADGFLYLGGRIKELINRGGEQISPGEIDAQLVSHPAVAASAAFAVPDTTLGEDIVAAVVLKPEMTATPRALRWWMHDRLAPSKVPRRIWFVDDLPRTATGKVQRGELARQWREKQR